MAIADALKANGYDPYYDDSWKGITVNDGEICIIGEAGIASVTVDGKVLTPEKLCETSRVCKIKGMVGFDSDAGMVNGTQIGTPAGFPAGDTAAVKAAFEAALDTAGISYTKVEVTEDIPYQTYVYCIHLVDGTELVIGGSTLSSCGCYPDFTS